jgi:hypothetical protein
VAAQQAPEVARQRKGPPAALLRWAEEVVTTQAA